MKICIGDKVCFSVPVIQCVNIIALYNPTQYFVKRITGSLLGCLINWKL